jgi:hypothetical protein
MYLNIDRGDGKPVGREREAVADLAVAANTEHAGANNLCRVLVEVVELHSGNSTTDTRGNGLAQVSNKIWNRKQLNGVVSLAGIGLDKQRCR